MVVVDSIKEVKRCHKCSMVCVMVGFFACNPMSVIRYVTVLVIMSRHRQRTWLSYVGEMSRRTEGALVRWGTGYYGQNPVK